MNFDRMMNQVATYWSPTGAVDRYGKPVWNAPIQIPCRWEYKTAQVINKRGEEIISKARVYLNNYTVAFEGYLYRGVSSDLVPPHVPDVFEIQAIGETPALRTLESLTTVYL